MASFGFDSRILTERRRSDGFHQRSVASTSRRCPPASTGRCVYNYVRHHDGGVTRLDPMLKAVLRGLMGKRGKIIAEIERQINRLDNRPGLCLFYAHHTAAVLWRHGQRAVIQAGSLQWPRVRREEDDGVINTHFAYEWTPGRMTAPCRWPWAISRKCTFGSVWWTARRLSISLPGT